jgi:hypothetical protein
MRVVFIFALALVMNLLIAGCGGGIQPPIIPPQDGNLPKDNNQRPGEPDEPEFTHFLFGSAYLEYNSQSGQIHRATNHTSQAHYNLTDPLSPPLCPDCITVEQLWHDEVEHNIGLKISLRNPTAFTFYDVRGIMRGGEGLLMLDSDGFTDLFSPETGVHNPFLAYCLENPDIDFAPDYTSERTYSLIYVELSDLDIDFIVEGSHPGHCEEPAIVRVVALNDANFTAWEGTATITIKAIDRQDDIALVAAHSPDIWDGVKEAAYSGNSTYELEFDNENHAYPGVYPVIFAARSHDDPNDLTIIQSAYVEVHHSQDANVFYGGGHPLEGVNCRRNNRSPYLLPTSLTGEDSISPFEFEDGSNFTKFNTLAVGADEKLYIGRRNEYEETWNMIFYEEGESREWYDILAGYFSDDVETADDAGTGIILTSDGPYTIANSTHKTWQYHPMDAGMYEWLDITTNYSYALRSFDMYLNAQAGYYWGYGKWEYTEWIAGHIFTDHETKLGDWGCLKYGAFLPIPGVGLAVEFTEGEAGPTKGLHLLDEEFEVISEWQTSAYIAEFGYDEDARVIYVTSSMGLFCFDTGLNELWNTSVEVPDFSSMTHLPVIADDGAIFGINSGTLTRIERDGSPGPSVEVESGCAHRPALLNDGTVITISWDGPIQHYDSQLNKIGEIPLPAGPGTGKSYLASPMVDSMDNLALYEEEDLYIIDTKGNVLAHRTFDGRISEIRLGPEHLFVALDYAIYRFGG